MKLSRMLALTYRDFLIFRRVKWKAVQFIYFPITTVLIWGLFAIYSRETALEAGLSVLVINIFWSFAQLSQNIVNIQMMEDIWSNSLKQVLLAGFTETEYIVSRLLSSTVTSFAVVFMMLGLAVPFGLNIFSIHLVKLLFCTILASLSLAIMVSALLLVMGREYGFLAWSALQIFILLSAPFFPADVFPRFIQYISYVMPFTDVFAAARMIATTGVIENSLVTKALIISTCYLAISWPLYKLSFRRAKKTGLLAKMT